MLNIPQSIEVVPFLLASVLFLAKHLLGDFVLQNGWISSRKAARTDWLPALALHVGIHAALTAGIFLIFAPQLALVATLCDFVVHAIIDRSKALLSLALQATPDKGSYWWLLGGDQALHQLTNIVFAIILATA